MKDTSNLTSLKDAKKKIRHETKSVMHVIKMKIKSAFEPIHKTETARARERWEKSVMSNSLYFKCDSILATQCHQQLKSTSIGCYCLWYKCWSIAKWISYLRAMCVRTCIKVLCAHNMYTHDNWIIAFLLDLLTSTETQTKTHTYNFPLYHFDICSKYILGVFVWAVCALAQMIAQMINHCL